MSVDLKKNCNLYSDELFLFKQLAYSCMGEQLFKIGIVLGKYILKYFKIWFSELFENAGIAIDD